LSDFSKKQQKPILVGCNGGPYTEKISKLLEKHKIPVYHDCKLWVETASGLTKTQY